MQLSKPIIIVCEGTSERVYIQELNKLLRDEDINYSIVPKEVGCGQCSRVIKKYNSVLKENRDIYKDGRIYIWVDDDLYTRNETRTDRACANVFKNCKIPKDRFKFSIHNFEDFLSLHFDDDNLQKWLQLCNERGHSTKPMYSEECKELFRKHFFCNYKEGDIPFELTKERLQNLFRHNEDRSIFLHNGFAQLLKEEIFNDDIL